jgi:F420 biosynthesis protein FbiB-like protein
MMMREFYELIANRRSVRKFRKKTISDEQLTRIVEASKWAPSAHNAQPWRFFILQTSSEKEKLAKAMGATFRQDLEAEGEAPELIEDLVHASVERFSSAPVLILACLTMQPMDSYPDKKRRQAEFLMAVQSVAAALHTMLLAAHVEGLAACWFCAPLFCPDTVQQTLGLSDEFIPQALVTLGVADEVPEPPIRHPFEEFVTFVGGKEG